MRSPTTGILTMVSIVNPARVSRFPKSFTVVKGDTWGAKPCGGHRGKQSKHMSMGISTQTSECENV